MKNDGESRKDIVMSSERPNDLVVLADNPQDMVQAQHDLIGWAEQKIECCNSEVADCEAVVSAIEKTELKPDIAKRLLSKARKRAEFYVKTQQALAAGYLIVPNMPSETVAIRVSREQPRWCTVSSEWKLEQKAEHLPAGEGRYVKPDPFFDTIKRETEPDKREISYYRATKFDEEIVLPVQFMKPAVIKRAGICMEEKIFDEIAVCLNEGPDPIVLGILNDASRPGRQICFLVAWFVDTADL